MENSFTVSEQYQRPAKLDFIQDSTVLWGDHLYAVEGQVALKCLDWRTGDTSWVEPVRSLGRMGFTCADGCLYLRGSEGKMLLVKASPEKFMATGTFSIPDHEKAIGSTVPVIAGGRLYLRDNTRLHCYDVRAARPPDAVAAYSVSLPKLAREVPADRASPVSLKPRVPKGVFVPTPHDVVKRMLELAEVVKTDVVYDLGSGDGRIVITAAKDYGCRAFGYDIDGDLVTIAREEAKKQGVDTLATFDRRDLFDVDLAKADVLTLYLLPQQNEKLVAQLKNMQPGSRVVAHQFSIPGVAPTATVTVQSEESGEKHTLYLYRLPLTAQAPPNQD